MCSHPIVIRNVAGNLQSDYQSIKAGSGLNTRYRLLLSRAGIPFGSYTIPCGKCQSCLLNKQLSRVPQFYHAIKDTPSCLVTLTYRNDTVPLMVSTRYHDVREVGYDFETGEIFYHDDVNTISSFVESEFRHDVCKEHHFKKSGSLRVHSIVDELGVEMILCPSLRREDVRLYIKRNRIKFQRAGCPMDFKFTLCGEYGPRTQRPHYHLLVAGLNESQCKMFFNSWQSEFGNVDIRQIRNDYNSRNHGKTKHGFIAASRYVAKYIHKGSFEESIVLDGVCEKPRNISSRFFGLLDLDGNLLFDCNELSTLDFCFNVDDKQSVSERLFAITHYTCSGMKRLPLPRTWLRFFYYWPYKIPFYDPNCKKKPDPESGCNSFKFVYRPLALYTEVQNALLLRNVDFREQQQDSFKSLFPDKDSSDLARLFVSCQNSVSESKEKSLCNSARQFYQESVY